MRRRDFIAILTASAATWPSVSTAQAPGMPVIGFLGSQSADRELLIKFRQGLAEWSYFEDQNVTIEYQWANNQYARLPELAAALVRHKVALIVAAGGSVAARAAKEATVTIPILFISGFDPIQEHLVASFNRPGGNATGVRHYNREIISKRLELLKDLVLTKKAHGLVPTAGKIAYLINDDDTGLEDQRAQIRGVEDTAKALGLVIHYARRASDLEPEFAMMAEQRTEALLVDSDPLFIRQRELIVNLAARYALPTGYRNREFVDAGGLMSYGPSLPESWRQIGEYAGRILNGARPESLPVQLQNKYELVINMKTAKALGLSNPPLLHALADEVIE